MEILNCENIRCSNLLVEQHFHGCYGVDFSNCSVEELLMLSKKLLTHGIGGFFPTLVTDSVGNIKKQIQIIKEAQSKQTLEMAKILGVHIEGIFLNPEKCGIHNKNLFLKPTVDNFKLIEDDAIKIVTLAPELDDDSSLQKYLVMKGIKVQAGHCVGSDLKSCQGATHLFNAMKGVNHRDSSTSLSALINDKIYTEIIADGIHLNEDILKLIFKAKPENKIIFVSDSLPIAQSDAKEMEFAGSKIYYDGKKATSESGTIAGSTSVLDKIIKRLSEINPEDFEKYVKMASDNVCKYHEIELNGQVWWNEQFEIVAVEKDGIVYYKNV